MIRNVLNSLGFLLRDRDTRGGRLTNAILYVLNAVFIGLYIASTVSLSERYLVAIRVAELALATVFLGEYVVRVYSADDRFQEVTNPYTVIDLVAVLPVFLAPWFSVSAQTGFLRGVHTLRIFRFIRLLVNEQQVFGRHLTIATVRRMELSMTIFLIFFIATGPMYAFEEAVNGGIDNFADAFYYTVIAVSTVGFGDIVPQTAGGRWVTVTAVLVGFVLIPWQASRLRNISDAGTATCRRCGQEVSERDCYCRRCGLELDDVAGPADG